MNSKLMCFRIALAVLTFGSCMFLQQWYRMYSFQRGLKVDHSVYRIRAEGEHRLYNTGTNEGLEIHLDGPVRKDLKVKLVIHDD